jgi:hypothetical protein
MFDFSDFRFELFSFQYECKHWPFSETNWRIGIFTVESVHTTPRSLFMVAHNYGEWDIDLFFIPIK